MRKNSYFSLTKTKNEATLNIYGDITSMPFFENDMSVDRLSKQLAQLGDVSKITVYINSYGGEVAEGLAIYNALKRHKAQVTTYCDGFACSIASVIFMAGDERIMSDSSLLMIHNAWSVVEGNAQELRKQADDLEKITQASITAYKAHSTLSEEEIVALMDAESWLLPDEALEYGFATAIEATEHANASQNAKMCLLDIIKQHRAELAEAKEEESEEPDTNEEKEEPENEDESPENEPSEDDPDDEGDSEESEDEDEAEKAAQRWSGFFNALIKNM